MKRTRSILATFFLLPAALLRADENISAPPVAREMRGAWIATVANIDWPSKPGLSATQQQAELISLLDHAVQLHLNAVFFQVRSVCDALYASPFEPWSEYLTGIQGRSPGYDPLALAVTEAHKRGLEIHAWFNPFRAAHPESKSPPATNHVTRTHPEIVRHYGRQTWLDPGEPEAQARALAAVLDVVKRYDVDGVVFDDYFYPYPEKDWAKRALDFPDDASWKRRSVAETIAIPRDDWRRANINQFIQKISQSIKAAKPQVQFGISPFGIWRPGVPMGIDAHALDAYGKLYADAPLWLRNGWVDYLAPQLYWPIAPREHSFPLLFQWWRQQNPKGRHVFAALNDGETGKKFSDDEIGRQINAVRTQTSNGGEIHYHLRSITENPTLAAAVRAQYAQPALVPATPWITTPPPLKPKLTVDTGNNSAHLRWENAGTNAPRWWLCQSRANGVWTTQIFPGGQADYYFNSGIPDAVSLHAVNRLGNLSEPMIWTPKKYSPLDTTKGATKMQK